MMKKLMVLALSLICILTLVACENKTAKDSDAQNDLQQSDTMSNLVKFEATILEIYEGSLLVEPLEGSQESKSADKIYVSTKTADGSVEWQVGDSILITYDGTIMESYPAQLGQVYKLEKVS